MKTHRFLAASIALLLAPTARAVNFTWDGGGVDSNIATSANWNPDGAPPTNIATTDLIFAGTTRLAPNFAAIFSAHSLTFNNTSGPFVLGGSALTIGTGGIVNSDADTQTFNNTVTLGASAAFTTNAGFMNFATVGLGTNTLTVNGASSMSAGDITGTGTVTMSGLGFFSFALSGTKSFDINANAGVLSTTADGTTDVFNSSSLITVNNGGIFTAHESLTLDGAVLSRASGGSFGVDPGKIFTAQNGATVTFTGASQSLDSGTTNITGAGTTLSAAGIGLSNGGAMTVSADADATNNGGITIGVVGSGALTITGAGSTWVQTNAAQGVTVGAASGGAAALNVNSGGVFTTSAALTTIAPTGTLSISGGTFTSNGDLTINGGSLTRDAAGSFILASGRVLTVQNGGSAAFTNPLAYSTNATISVTSGATLSSTSYIDLANGGGTVNTTVDGVGSKLVTGGSGPSDWGSSNGTATVIFQNGATGTLAPIRIGGSSGGNGTASVLSDADVTSGDLTLAPTAVATTAQLNVTGAGSTWTINGAGALTMGAASASTATINVNTGGVFSTGTGPVTINKTGTINIANVTAPGTVNLNGNTIVDGGAINIGGVAFSGSALNLATDKNLTVQNGGDLALGAFSLKLNGLSTFTLTGAGSTYTGDQLVYLSGSPTINILNGAVATLSGSAGGFANARGTLLVDGVGSALNTAGPSSYIGFVGASASVTFRNSATGSLKALDIPLGTFAGTSGSLSVQSGANLTTGGLNVAASAVALTGAVTVTGAGSQLTQSGAAPTTYGAANSSTGSLTISNGGTYTTGTAATNVFSTGTITIAGGTLAAKGDLGLYGGHLTRDTAGSLTFAPGTNFTISGGDATLTGNFTNFDFGTGGTLSVFGVGSTFTTITSGLQVRGGSTLSVQSGGVATLGAGLVAGNATPGNVLVDGAGSALSAAFDVYDGFGGGAGAMTFSNGAIGTIGGSIFMAASGAGTSGQLNVLSGAHVSVGGQLAAPNSLGTGTVVVSGAGSMLTLTANSGTNIGYFSGGASALTVSDGAVFNADAAGVMLNATGTLNISGGTVNIPGPIVRNGGAVNFTSGALSFAGGFNVGVGGLLGPNLTLAANRQLTLTGTTTVDAFQTLTLAGGALTTGALVNNGAIDFQKGTLAVTGAGGFNIGSGALGASVTLAAGANLNVSAALTVASNGVLTVAGGGVAAGSLTNAGLVEQDAGTLNIGGTVVNQSGADLFLGKPLTVGGVLANASGAHITLENGTGRIGGAGSVSNAGLLTGDGTIATALTNAVGGELRAEAGKTLTLAGTTAPNAGKLNLLGGELDFTQPFTNSATGQINGRGVLNFGAGFTNSGQMNLSAGFTDVFGSVNMLAGSKLITSGGATATFYSAFTNNGTEVRTSTGSATVFFGLVNGAGPFTGTGQVYFEGGYSPGNSPALVTNDADVIFGDANTLTLEIGGLTAGTQYDKLVLAGGATQLGGTLVIDFINGFVPAEGEVFDLLDFNPAATTGDFSNIVIADPLPAGLALDTGMLRNDGTVRVVPEPAAPLLLAVGALSLVARRRRHKTQCP